MHFSLLKIKLALFLKFIEDILFVFHISRFYKIQLLYIRNTYLFFTFYF